MDTLMLWSQQFYGTLRAYYNNKNNNLNPDIFSGANGENQSHVIFESKFYDLQ